MPALSNIVLAPISPDPTDSTRSVIKVTYTVTFDSNDLALKTPYKSRAHVWADDTNVAGDVAGGVDDKLYEWALRVIHPLTTPQTFTDQFTVSDARLNEDRPTEPAPVNPNPDEIRVRIGLDPLQAYSVMSAESNLRTIAFV
jgi:hypothetical protein